MTETDSKKAFVFLCRSDEIVEGRFREIEIPLNDQPVDLIVTRHGGLPRAWLNVCPHQGRPLNHAPDRFLTDETGNLVCSAHGAVFEPAAGLCIAGPCRNAALRPVELFETNGEIRAKAPP